MSEQSASANIIKLDNKKNNILALLDTSIKITIFGVMFGCCFPLIAWCFEFSRYNLHFFTWHSLKLIHIKSPLLYMIDTAPFFLGIFALLAGRYKSSTKIYDKQLQQLVYSLEEQIEIRTQELEEANIQLKKRFLQAKRFAAEKADFLASMSHEIRTPLNAIIGMATVVEKQIAKQKEDERLYKHVRQIQISSQHLLKLINNILDLSKIESGEFTINLESFSISELLQYCKGMLKQRGYEKKLCMTLESPELDNVTIRSDRLRLAQVLINLLNNAIKFTPENGSIELAAKIIERKNGLIKITFSVTDSGRGISEQEMNSLFRPYKQIDEEYGRGDGTGLGLVISQKIVEMLGGKIEVSSVVGEGSCFYFTLLLQETEAKNNEGAHSADEISFAGKRIMVVDDIEINRIIVQELLADTAIKIETASDGQEALEMFQSSPAGYYNLILMDMQMPRLDGYAATQAIRSSSHPDSMLVPIVAMTANAMHEDAVKARQIGMNAHLPKPIDVTTMLHVLQQYMHMLK